IGSDVAGYHGRSNPDDIGATTAAALSSWKAKTANEGSTNQAPHPDPLPIGWGEGEAKVHGEIAPNIYIRWAEFSVFCGFFLNGGHGERRLWKRSQPELEIVR